MSQIPDSVLSAAMALSPQSRAALAEELWLSVEKIDRADNEVAWANEIEQRLAALDRGETELIPGEQVMREARLIASTV
jgi:putative addiction module component (TIGR02574 family)